MNFTSHSDNFWDSRYETEEFVYGKRPNAFVEAMSHLYQPGMKALVPGDGEGRHGVWLAEQGLDVTTVDMSAVGKSKAERLAADRGVKLDSIVADVITWNWPAREYDLIVSVFLHLHTETRQNVHSSMARALRPGGHLIIVGFRPEQIDYREKYGSVGGPPLAEMMFTSEMLTADFSNLELVQLEYVDHDFGDHGSHTGKGAVVQGVFRKPA